MTYVGLAKQATVLLARLMTGSLSGPPEEAADRLFDLVSGRLVRKGESDVVRDFQRDPGSPGNRTALTKRLGRELMDDTFRWEVTNCLDESTSETSGDFAQVAGRDSYGAGRDLRVDQSRRASTTKNHFGGVLIAVVAVVALIAVGFGAKAVLNSLGNSLGSTSLTGDSTCAEFLRADSATQVAAMKELYLSAGRADRAGDPFILQNATYSCGQSPNMKLSTLAR
jgi:hypothetical protein